MKGIVFTEFIEMIDDRFGLEVTEHIISHSKTLKTGGSYTAVGTYPHGELVEMVSLLSQKTGIEVKALLEAFGEYLFGVLVKSYPSLMEPIRGLFDFLQKIEDYIHVEVRKLYPEAELPTFKTALSEDEKELTMIYESERAMVDFGVGLIKGSSKHFSEEVTISTKDLTPDQSGKKVEIKVRKLN